MTFLYGFITGAATVSVVWGFFHAKIKAELNTLKNAAESVAKKASSKFPGAH